MDIAFLDAYDTTEWFASQPWCNGLGPQGSKGSLDRQIQGPGPGKHHRRDQKQTDRYRGFGKKYS
jgi:hypothetical protein